MEPRVRVLRELVRDSLYVPDERAVANAILARALVRQTVASATFRVEQRFQPIRSFRRDRNARSFRLTAGTTHHA